MGASYQDTRQQIRRRVSSYYFSSLGSFREASVAGVFELWEANQTPGHHYETRPAVRMRDGLTMT
jgi:hypothetical protein